METDFLEGLDCPKQHAAAKLHSKHYISMFISLKQCLFLQVVKMPDTVLKLIYSI